MSCPNCGAENPDSAESCSLCYFVLRPGAQPPAAQPPAPEPQSVDSEPAPKAPITERDLRAPRHDWRCGNCGADNAARDGSCAMCGMVYSAARGSVQKSGAPLIRPEAKPRPPLPQKGERAVPKQAERDAAAPPRAKEKRPPPPSTPPARAPKYVPPERRIPVGRFPQRISVDPPSDEALPCPACASRNPRGSASCAMCGHNLGPAVAPSPNAPLTRPEAEPASPLPQRGERDAPRQGEPADAGRKFVLIVEDDPRIASLLDDFLGEAGVEWRARTASGGDVVAYAEAMNTGLVLMDIMLAGHKSGVDAYRMLRESPWLPKSLPVIFLTALPREKAEALVPSGDPGVRLLRKPVDFTALTRAIRELTGKAFLK